MTDRDWLAERFEDDRGRLRGVAYRMLGSLSEAEDAVQEAWLRLSRANADAVENLGGWLTTVVARVCLDMLRSRKSRREEPLDVRMAETSSGGGAPAADPEQEVLLADAVGLAMLVVLEALDPAERTAFVLHDMFAMPFDEIAGIVDRSPEAARQLASRARRRVHGSTVADTDLARRRHVVDAFLTAARGGHFEALLDVLHADAVMHTDGAAATPTEIRGAAALARRAIAGGARAARPALVNGDVGVVIAPRGRLMMVLRFTIVDDRIVGIDAVSDPQRLQQLELAVLEA
jgi:RNA polymerase sigma factor (sigma-70 family)